MKRIGILGGGQLARMLSLAAYPLGITTLCLDPADEACARDVTNVIKAEYTDEAALEKFASEVDVITIENENLPIEKLQWLNSRCSVLPTPNAIAVAQDRLLEKKLFTSLGIATPAFYEVNTYEELESAIKALQFPAVIKTRRFGYDGKGQFVVQAADDLPKAWEALKGHALIAEQWIKFDREVSLIAVRDANKVCAFYPLTENVHRQGILRISRAPYIDATLYKTAQDYLQKILEHFNYIGVLAVEFFVCNGKLIANEMAPRVHNSGHWTIEGAVTSQFANHVRAILGLPLGNTDARGFSAMLNCIGEEPNMSAVLQHSHVYYHCYHKTAKPQRKLAHITVNTETKEACEKTLMQVTNLLQTT